MNKTVTTGIVLTRINFSEADRIITILTPDHGKIRVMVKGARKPKSKMAAGIELFSICQITFITGRGEIRTLISARPQTHYKNIVVDINRTMLGYEVLKRINKVTEDAPGKEYFDLLSSTLGALDNAKLSNDAVEFWFSLRLLQISGHAPNLHTDARKNPLNANDNYEFDLDSMTFVPKPNGSFNAKHIKLFRLCISSPKPDILLQVQNGDDLLPISLGLAKAMMKLHGYI